MTFFLLFLQHTVDEGYGDRSFSDGRGNALDVAAAHITDCNSRQARLEEIWRAGERPLRGGEIIRRQIRSCLDESFLIQRDTVVKPCCSRYGTGHYEHVPDETSHVETPRPDPPSFPPAAPLRFHHAQQQRDARSEHRVPPRHRRAEPAANCRARECGQSAPLLGPETMLLRLESWGPMGSVYSFE